MHRNQRKSVTKKLIIELLRDHQQLSCVLQTNFTNSAQHSSRKFKQILLLIK